MRYVHPARLTLTFLLVEFGADPFLSRVIGRLCGWIAGAWTSRLGKGMEVHFGKEDQESLE